MCTCSKTGRWRCASTTTACRPGRTRAIHAGWRRVERVIRRVLEIRPGIEVEDEADVWREFDYAAGLLADGRTHLCGERFTAADLTFASLAAAVDRAAQLRRAPAPAAGHEGADGGARATRARAPGRRLRDVAVRAARQPLARNSKPSQAATGARGSQCLAPEWSSRSRCASRRTSSCSRSTRRSFAPASASICFCALS